MMTELKAVNRMLALAGEPPVNTLSTTIPEVLQAVAVLSQVSEEVQAVGWHFNSDDALSLSPGPDKTISVPTDALRIDATEPALDLVARSGKLYDKGTNSNQFDEAVDVDIVRLLTFEDLPAVAQHYITLRASRRFLREHLGSGSADNQLALDEQLAYQRLVETDGANADYNLLENNPDAWRAAQRIL